jgi:phosphatidylinositol 3-kinase
MLGLFQEQCQFFMGIMEEQIRARDSKGKKAQKESALKKNLAKYTNVSGRVGLLPVPLCPEVEVLGVKADGCFMFRSALYPAVVTFKKQPDETILREEVRRRKAEMTRRTSLNNKKISELLGEKKDLDGNMVSGSSGRDNRKSRSIKGLAAEVKQLPPTNTSTIASRALNEEYSVIFKSGDDLRQDQLIIVMIRLFDSLLKAEGLDLCLTPYSILATSPTTGLVEFVKGSMPISAVLAKHGNIQEFFQANNQLEDIPNVRETYIRSCAGYCVITYILGIGDRHLDNIMMLPQGRFFHIDFGFIFGRDPKPMPPAFRLTQSMVDGFGGEEGFRKFKRLCGQVYNLLRRSAGLVINLLHLSKEGSVPDLSYHPTLTANEVIEKVEEKFRLDLNDEQAEAFFSGLIGECVGALAPRVLEVFHQIAVARR